MTRAEIIREKYGMRKHPEGGAYSEVYTAPFEKDGRPLAGNIYYLLEGREFSCMHELDCDEIWFYHEGCGLRITVLTPDGRKETRLLGKDILNGEQHMAVIPKGCVFAAGNLEEDEYTLISCITTPGYKESGFRMVGRKEAAVRFPDVLDELAGLFRADV